MKPKAWEIKFLMTGVGNVKPNVRRERNFDTINCRINKAVIPSSYEKQIRFLEACSAVDLKLIA
jgi:hypothetical protein